MNKPIASLSLDLDNQWSYMKIHGESGWETFPSYLDIFVPHVLQVLEELGLKITFFVVAQDAVFERNHKYLKMISDAGHEIANHSFKHETWLHLYSREELENEIGEAHKLLEAVTGQKPIGFRGPGFSWSYEVMDVLAEKGYVYDGSTLPTIIGPLARWYYFRTSGLSAQEKEDRKEIFGKFSDGFRRLKPYFWKTKSDKKLLEIPVTTMPIFRVPFHLSYLIWLSGISSWIMKAYLYLAIYLCKLTKTEPSFLLHPLDLIGGDQVSALAFFPGMDVSSDKKVALFKEVIGILNKHFTWVRMDQHAKSLKNNKKLPIISLNQLNSGMVPESS